MSGWWCGMAGDAHDNRCESRSGNACGSLQQAACFQHPECFCECPRLMED
jgi:hypothetical protein